MISTPKAGLYRLPNGDRCLVLAKDHRGRTRARAAGWGGARFLRPTELRRTLAGAELLQESSR